MAFDFLRKRKGRGAVSLEDCGEPADLELLENAYIREERKITVHKMMERLKPASNARGRRIPRVR